MMTRWTIYVHTHTHQNPTVKQVNMTVKVWSVMAGFRDIWSTTGVWFSKTLQCVLETVNKIWSAMKILHNCRGRKCYGFCHLFLLQVLLLYRIIFSFSRFMNYPLILNNHLYNCVFPNLQFSLLNVTCVLPIILYIFGKCPNVSDCIESCYRKFLVDLVVSLNRKLRSMSYMFGSNHS